MNDIAAVYQNKNVLVIGGRGFVGGHLVERLLELGAEVFVLDDDSHPSSAPVNEAAAQYTGDAGDEQELLRVYNTALPDFIFNLAAKVAGVLYNEDHHLEMFENNMPCQMVPLRTSQYVPGKAPAYLHVSSVCVYGQGETSPCNDRFTPRLPPTGANAGYSWSKRIGELYAGWLPEPQQPVIVRPTNMYGPWDHFGPDSHVIPAFIERVHRSPFRMTIFGTGREIREFIYVTDAVEGMLYALAFGKRGEVYNIGTNGQTMIDTRDLARLIAATLGVKGQLLLYDDSKGGGDESRYTDCQRLNALGFKHQVSLEAGIKKTVEWYLANISDGR